MATIQPNDHARPCPPDLTLGLVVTGLITVMLLGLVALAGIPPGNRPRSEARPPDGAAVYVDIAAPLTPAPLAAP